MAHLTVRNVSEAVVDALKRRAAANNRTVEAEHRELLRAALLGGGEDFATWADLLRQRFALVGRQYQHDPRKSRRCGMITSLQLLDFKNFPDETLRVGPFTLIVGTNASGKSNIRDAFRLLHGIGRGYTLAEIVGGKYGAGGQVEWGAYPGRPARDRKLRTRLIWSKGRTSPRRKNRSICCHYTAKNIRF